MGFWAQPGSTQSIACGDDGAPGEVTQKQLDELHIALVKHEED